MKNRKIMSISIIVLLLVSSLLYLCAVVAAESASVNITVDSNPTKIGDVFIASLNIAGVDSLWGWNAQISWNPEVLKATRATKGAFLTSEGASDMFPPVVIDNVGGTFPPGLSQVLLERSGVSGGGVLVRITFEVIGVGSADISINGVTLLDISSGEMPFTVGQIPGVIISTGSSSTPTTGPQGGAVVIVSTDNVSYLLGALVSASARVTFNGGGVANCDVAFTLLQPDGTALGTYVDTTDGSGLAGFTFRVPVPEPDPSIIFGAWSILASVSVSGVVITDAAEFMVGSSLLIKSISIPSSIQRSGRVPINVTLEGDISGGLVLTASIFDSAQVPLGMSTVSIGSQTRGTTTISAEVVMPSWAFTGQGIIYVNILTDAPEKSGIPYCPQATMTFQIT